ncbi:MAG TPA: flavin reductase [Kiritimatiellia bacterium]|nr:flavin reductase [Kiritimatiellia bacterium]HRZ11332.1 flavin reductase [Kiritimatiellia bacterium]HSA17117.1 flavin reductase [Kiritimatiellia bacterium]
MQELRIEDFQENPFRLIGQQWMLITAGTREKFNTMTASWGGLGVLWDRHVCFAFVRPSRYTFEFLEKSAGFTLCFFDESWRDKLMFCGSNSGRNVDKVKKTGLSPVTTKGGNVWFEQARLMIECRKIAFTDLDPKHFLDPTIRQFYEGPDYHRIYIGEIERILSR